MGAAHPVKQPAYMVKLAKGTQEQQTMQKTTTVNFVDEDDTAQMG